MRGTAFSFPFSSPFFGPSAPADNYKAKIMRQMLPPPYNRDFEAVIPTILTAIGQSDNLIGGLFGSDDFLPDEG